MPLDRRSTKPEEMIQVWVPKKRMRRPFPLMWGLAALGLFALFAVITQLQFSRLSQDAIHEARLDTFDSDLRAYEVAQKAHDDCIASIQTREVYRGIFGGIASMFQRNADLPVELFPESERAKEYQAALTTGIQEYIVIPVELGLPPRLESDCPKVPTEEPQKPER